MIQSALEQLIDCLSILQYPKHISAVGLLAHRAPRVLSIGICHGEIVENFSRSILAGGQQSTSWASGLLFDLVTSLGYVVPDSPCYEHVEDLYQPIVCSNNDDLLSNGLGIWKTVGPYVICWI